MLNLTSYKGDTSTNSSIVIVGNGPSLARTPMNFRYPSIAMNRISLLYENTLWRPDYFVCTTTNIQYKDWLNDIIRTLDLNIPCFVWEDLLRYIPTKYTNIVPIKCDYGNIITNKPSLSLWCSDPENEPISKFGTSLMVATQIAVFMGYKTLYLVGCDLGFSDPNLLVRIAKRVVNYSNKLTKNCGFTLKVIYDDRSHFAGNYDTPGCSSRVLNSNMLCAHRTMKMAADKYNFKIFNASLSKGLNVHPYADISDILEP